MMDFTVSWSASAICLTAFAVFAGRAATGRWSGVLIDGRGRFSLTHFQTVSWTLLILSTFIAAAVYWSFDDSKLRIDASLLQLMAVAAGSAVLATGVKGIKDAAGSAAGEIARAGANVTRPDNTTSSITAKFSQMWLEEEGPLADRVVSITKFQSFLFTLVALAAFCSLALEAQGLPSKLPENFVWLLGISHAGYVAGKIPDKTK